MSLILKFLPLLLPLCRCEQSVLLTSDSPAVLDAPITFYGRSVLIHCSGQRLIFILS